MSQFESQPATMREPSPDESAPEPGSSAIVARGCLLSTTAMIALMVVVAGSVLIGVWGLVRGLTSSAPVGDDVHITQGQPTITRIQKLNSLAVMRVNIADIMIAEGKSYRGSWLVKGDATITVDCDKAVVRNVDLESKTLVIALPAPRITQPRVDHARTVEWSVEKTTWVPFVGDEGAMRGEAMRKEQELIEKAAAKPEVLEDARTGTQRIIENIYGQVDWKVRVEWLDRPSKQETKR